MAVTVLDVALARGAHEQDGGIEGAEFARVGLPILGGCERCGETLGAYNAYPSRSGFLRCAACLGPHGFEHAEAFEAFCAAQDARRAGDE